MPTRLENLLASAFESSRGEPRAEHAVYARLQFLSRVMRHAPAATGCTALLLWLDAKCEVASVGVTEAGVVIGRDAGCDVVLASPRVSRRHCAVRRAGVSEGAMDLVLEDLGSSNGTRVNGRVVVAYTPWPLRDGDVLEVGGVALAVVSCAGRGAVAVGT